MIGSWVAQRIEQGIFSRNSATATVYISDFLAPMVQELTASDHLSEDSVQELDAFLKTAARRFGVVAIEIWREDGRILYSGNHQSIGKHFDPDASRTRAFRGELSTEYDRPSPESAAEDGGREGLLEVYAPIYEHHTGNIIAVAEFYENVDDLRQAVAGAKLESWLITSLVLVVNFLAFSTIVRGGSDTIERQKFELTRRVDELSQAMQRETELRDRIERGARQAIDENERFLRSIGSDLHDGPAQLIGLALLHLDRSGNLTSDATIATIRGALSDAVREIRGISSGLLLPDLEAQGLEESIIATVRNHEMRTGTTVDLVCKAIPADCPQHVKICLCRFIQEGLANSFRHAAGLGQRVVVVGGKEFVRAIVSDDGPGMPASYPSEDGARLGLRGLRGRLESIRGSLTVGNQPRRGTRLVAWLPLEAGEPYVV